MNLSPLSKASILAFNLALFSCIFQFSPVFAQKMDVPTCVVRPSEKAEESTITLVVASSDQAQFSAKGFSVQPCNGRESALVQLNKQMCEIAASGKTTVISYFTRTYHASPAEICATTTKLL